MRDEDNNTLKVNQDIRINRMFYAAADGEKKTSIVFDLFIILEITSNTHRGGRGGGGGFHSRSQSF